MRLKQVAEVGFQVQNKGRSKPTAQTYSKKDMQQLVIMGVGQKMRMRYLEGKKTELSDDYYYYTGDLDIKEYELSDANMAGMRRISITEDVVKLAHNMDITNVYPSGNCRGADGTMEITQVSPGEENFYLSPDFENYRFFVEKGRGLNFYHVPPCVKKIQVERIYVNDNMDISLDLAYDILAEILGITFKTKQFPVKPTDNSYSPDAIELRRRLEEQNPEV